MTKKDAIVQTAFRLFKQNGFYATGVDMIMREAAVSKRTLYKYFPTKNELIVAVLQHYRTTYQQHVENLLDNDGESAREKIQAIFVDAATWSSDANFHGCLAVNAMGEFAGKDETIVEACRQFKQWEISLLTELCRALDVDHADRLAYKLFLVLEGMAAAAQVNKGPIPVDIGAMADDMIDLHLSGG